MPQESTIDTQAVIELLEWSDGWEWIIRPCRGTWTINAESRGFDNTRQEALTEARQVARRFGLEIICVEVELPDD